MSRRLVHLPIPCTRVAHRVEEELDLRLHTSARRAFRTHLRRCPNCSAYLDSLKKIVLLYRRISTPRPTGTMKRRLHALIHHQFVVADPRRHDIQKSN